jgi:IS66 C-terminal element
VSRDRSSVIVYLNVRPRNRNGDQLPLYILRLSDTRKHAISVDPQAYLHDVLSKIVARHPMGRIDELLPFAYVPAAEKAAA